MTYLTIKTLHLLAAIAFIGTLFFQVLILAPLRAAWPGSTGGDRSGAGPAGASRHPLRCAGALRCRSYPAWPYRTLLANPLSSTFTILLSLKILLAFLIIGHYVALIFLRRGRHIGERGMHWLNVSLLVHAVLLVVCAKSMFVL